MMISKIENIFKHICIAEKSKEGDYIASLMENSSDCYTL